MIKLIDILKAQATDLLILILFCDLCRFTWRAWSTYNSAIPTEEPSSKSYTKTVSTSTAYFNLTKLLSGNFIVINWSPTLLFLYIYLNLSIFELREDRSLLILFIRKLLVLVSAVPWVGNWIVRSYILCNIRNCIV